MMIKTIKFRPRRAFALLDLWLAVQGFWLAWMGWHSPPRAQLVRLVFDAHHQLIRVEVAP